MHRALHEHSTCVVLPTIEGWVGTWQAPGLHTVTVGFFCYHSDSLPVQSGRRPSTASPSRPVPKSIERENTANSAIRRVDESLQESTLQCHVHVAEWTARCLVLHKLLCNVSTICLLLRLELLPLTKSKPCSDARDDLFKDQPEEKTLNSVQWDLMLLLGFVAYHVTGSTESFEKLFYNILYSAA